MRQQRNGSYLIVRISLRLYRKQGYPLRTVRRDIQRVGARGYPSPNADTWPASQKSNRTRSSYHTAQNFTQSRPSEMASAVSFALIVSTAITLFASANAQCPATYSCRSYISGGNAPVYCCAGTSRPSTPSVAGNTCTGFPFGVYNDTTYR